MEQWKLINCDWVAHYLGLDNEGSDHEGIYAEEAKEDVDSADSPAGRYWLYMLLWNFSVLTSGPW